jgi:hypothetical protein
VSGLRRFITNFSKKHKRMHRQNSKFSSKAPRITQRKSSLNERDDDPMLDCCAQQQIDIDFVDPYANDPKLNLLASFNNNMCLGDDQSMHSSEENDKVEYDVVDEVPPFR